MAILCAMEGMFDWYFCPYQFVFTLLIDLRRVKHLAVWYLLQSILDFDYLL